MDRIDTIKRIINNRPVIVMLHGKSVETLENYIVQLKDLDICYVGINYFELLEEHILSKINKKFDFILDSSGIVPEKREHCNKYIRMPRIKKYLDSDEKKIWITDNVTINDFVNIGCNDFIQQYKNQIILVDKDIGLTLDVANSTVLVLGLSIIAEAKTIVICGMDGYRGKYEDNLSSYCYPEEFVKDRIEFTNSEVYTGVIQDTLNFENTILDKINLYGKQFNVKIPPIFNCSKDSIHNIFPKITYKELKEWLV